MCGPASLVASLGSANDDEGGQGLACFLVSYFPLVIWRPNLSESISQRKGERDCGWETEACIGHWLEKGLGTMKILIKLFFLLLFFRYWWRSVQFSSVAQLYPTLCDPMNCSTPGLPVHHQLPEFTQTYVHQVGDAIQPSHPLPSPFPPPPNPSQHEGLFQWVNSSHEVAKVLEFQL